MAQRGRRRRGRRAPAVPLAARLRPRVRRGHRASSRSAPASRSRWRTCTPGGPRGARCRSTSRAGTPPSRTTPTPPSTSRTPRRRASGPGRDGPAARRPAAAHPPDRRHRLGQGRAPGARPRHPAGRRAARAPRRRRLRRPHRARDQHPQGRRPRGPRARPDGGAGVHPAQLRGRAGDRDEPARGRHAGRGPAPGWPGHPRPDPRGGAGVLRRTRASPVRRSGPSPRRPGSTRRSCTTTSGPRTTCSSPPWRSRSTRARWCRPCSSAGVDGAGERLLRLFLSVWDDPATRLPLIALVRSGAGAGGAGDPAAARGSSGWCSRRCAPRCPPSEADRRVQLVASQMIGLVVAPLPAARSSRSPRCRPRSVVAWVAPTLQRYLDGPLPADRRADGGLTRRGLASTIQHMMKNAAVIEVDDLVVQRGRVRAVRRGLLQHPARRGHRAARARPGAARPR